MTTVGVLIGWAAICGAYLRFRKAYQVQGVTVVEASKSPLQPALAIYGLAWSLFLSQSRTLRMLIIVIFQGYLVFTRNNAYWGLQKTSWGFSIAPWVFIGVFVILVSGWYIRTRVKLGRWTWLTRPLDKVDLAEGIAPLNTSGRRDQALWVRLLQQILDAI